MRRTGGSARAIALGRSAARAARPAMADRMHQEGRVMMMTKRILTWAAALGAIAAAPAARAAEHPALTMTFYTQPYSAGASLDIVAGRGTITADTPGITYDVKRLDN